MIFNQTQMLVHRYYQGTFLMGHTRPLFNNQLTDHSLFYKQSTINCSIKVADDWIRTRVLLYWKRLRCQVYHNPLPNHYQGAEMVSTSLKRKAANYSEETAS